MKRVHNKLFNRLKFICSSHFIEHKESNEYYYFTNKSFIEELLNICLHSVIKTA